MKFILTKELGRLARWLRLLGFDTEYFDSDDMAHLFVTAFNEKRTIVTKIRKLSDTKSLKVIYVKSDLLKEQFIELKKKIKARVNAKGLFTRCADCNKKVFEIAKSSARDFVPEYVFKTQKKFFQCPSCAKVFWKATHWDRAKEFLDEIRS